MATFSGRGGQSMSRAQQSGAQPAPAPAFGSRPEGRARPDATARRDLHELHNQHERASERLAKSRRRPDLARLGEDDYGPRSPEVSRRASPFRAEVLPSPPPAAPVCVLQEQERVRPRSSRNVKCPFPKV